MCDTGFSRISHPARTAPASTRGNPQQPAIEPCYLREKRQKKIRAARRAKGRRGRQRVRQAACSLRGSAAPRTSSRRQGRRALATRRRGCPGAEREVASVGRLGTSPPRAELLPPLARIPTPPRLIAARPAPIHLIRAESPPLGAEP
jgi:hypothetical protein